MGLLDGITDQIRGGGFDVAALAAKVGLSPEQVQAALGAIGAAQAKDGDTATEAASQTGLPLDKIRALVAQIGGEGAAGKLAGMMGSGGPAGFVRG